MTVQVKHFIELPDIISLRFECKHAPCTAVLQLGVNDIKQGTLFRCPVCGQDWALLNGGSPIATNAEQSFLKLVDAIKEVKTVCEKSPLGLL